MNELRAAWRALRARVEELAERRQHYLELFEQADDACLITNAAGETPQWCSLLHCGATVIAVDARPAFAG